MNLNNTTTRSLLFIFFLTSFIINPLKSQTIRVNDAVDDESSFSPEELIQNVLVSGTCADISNIKSVVNGNPTDLNSKSYGYFKRLEGSTFPFEEGIILTTGNAFSTTNGAPDLSNPSTGEGDNDLNEFIDPNTVFTDATVFEFDFTPSSDSINFRYMMASEEYTGNFPCLYSDSFAFLLKIAGTDNYENIAIIPDTTTPVSVTSVHPRITGGDGCDPQNEDYFEGYNLGDTNFNGRTTVLNASARVIPNTKYHIKLVIADANDGNAGSPEDFTFDSAVFLEAGSFNLGFDLGEDFLTDNNTAVCSDEISLTANIVAASYQWFKDGAIIPGATDQTYIANLGDGVYSCDIIDGNNCTGSDDIILEFVTAPSVNPLISVFQICDTDGNLTENFNLTLKEAEILNGQNPTEFEVKYFSDIDYTNEISDPTGYENTDAIETIYVRVINRESSSCFIDSSFNIQLTDLPTPTQPTVYRICDDTASGSDIDQKSLFLLNTKDAEILATVTNPSDYTISYHTLLVDAQTSSTTNAIDKDVDYLVTNSQRVYVRVENIANTDCNAISDDSAGSTFNSFELIVDAAPVVVTPPLDINRCDEDRVGFLDFDLITDQTPQILNGLDPSLDTTVFEVLYFDNLSDAESNTTSAIIANPYRVNTSLNPTIYARVHNVNNTTCYSIVDFKLKVTDTPTPTQPSVYRICDDTASGSDIDGISSFLLNTKDAEILATVTNPGEYTISYHTLLVDAQTSSTANAIDKDTDYQVTTSQRVYVRIENNNDPSQCYIVSDESASSTFTSFELVVDPLPVITDTVELKQCDDDTDGFSFFNLNEAASDISTNYLNETFVFYPSLLDAENDTAAFSEAEALVFENRTVTTDQVWARAISSENCYRIAQVDIIVSTTGLTGFTPRSFTVCDDFLDIDGNDTANNDDNDGITSFDFSSVTD